MAAKTDVISTPTTRRPAIVCFENSWQERLDSRTTIEPALRCLEAVIGVDIVHKDVATRANVEYYVDQWLGRTGRGMPRYRFGMFETHGSSSGLELSDGTLGLEDLADIIDGRAAGRIIFLGGCNVLARPDDDLRAFCRRTRARGLVGFTKQVDILEGAAFEMLLIQQTLGAANFKSIYNRMRKQHPGWTQRLGLRMAHATWASDQKITE